MLKFSSFIIFFFISFSIKTNAQLVVFQGKVVDKTSNLPISKVLVSFHGKKLYTNDDGKFRLLIAKGENEINFKHISYNSFTLSIFINNNINKDIYLSPKETLLEQVEIKKRITKTDGRLNNFELITNEDLAKKPGFLANPDLLNEIRTLPGVTNGGEGNSGLYIRGGSPGQNLVLFNHSTIYNPSHLLGFFSVFNSTAVRDAKVFKSGIPSQYTGRLSSVIDVSSDASLVDSLQGEASLSILSADANIALPITSNWTVRTSIRKTFMNQSIWPIVNKLSKDRSSINHLEYDFYDLNFSSSLVLSTKDKIFATAYAGGDKFGFELERFGVGNTIDWKNRAASIDWQHQIVKNATVNTTLSYAGYTFNFGLAQEGTAGKINSAIADYDLKSSLKLSLKKHFIKTGFSYVRHRFVPNTADVTVGNVNLDLGGANIYKANESAIFINDAINLGANLSLNVGLRATYYQQSKLSNVDRAEQKDSEYDKLFLEPNLNLAYQIAKSTTLKFSFSKNTQTLHLIPVAASNFPVDFWIPSTQEMPPEKGIQLSLGMFKNWDNGFEAYVDVYYKKMNNIIEFNGGVTNLLDNLTIEDHVFSGSGKIYGAEFFAKKSIGKFDAAVGYTISKNRRIFSEINGGRPFPFKYDRTHDGNVSANYQLNKRWKLSAYFTYATGNAYTVPISRYIISGSIINEYGEFNASRMPVYHRLDLAGHFQIKKTRRFSSELSLAIYNVYSRKNPIFDYFQFNGDFKTSVSVQKKSIALLPILPAISYKISFRK
ncbi:TonB-dependent receptor [Pedobacter endophyticus]|uniref:TonB-dependent receptor n=1 Tax=Pedobacter endophyticus TaxID=2789740 RepID=A0A7S9Q079_9SPHI|nr:TonB-dependent receptor [Pedobacter endophyticus]QPH41108.1 TonB-dependent receptor [Pedobacter endophyticus]